MIHLSFFFLMFFHSSFYFLIPLFNSIFLSFILFTFFIFLLSLGVGPLLSLPLSLLCDVFSWKVEKNMRSVHIDGGE